MVGLSVILESNQGDFRKRPSQILSKASAMTNLATNLQTPPFRLGLCCLCKQKLLPGKDIYMYKGDRGFCSVECRCRQISMDEQEATFVRGKGSSGP